MGKDYYGVLGIDKNSNEDQIRTAYKKLALKYHPDKNPDNVEQANAKFSEITEAYSVLSDQQKKQRYDTYGSADEEPHGHHGFSRGFNPNDIFAQMFGGQFNMNFNFHTNSGPRQEPIVEKGPDRRIEVPITIKDMFSGIERTVEFSRKIKCPTCKASGLKEGCSEKGCDRCHGRGQIVMVRREGFSVYQQITTCGDCGGSGKRTNPDDICGECNGAKLMLTKPTVTISTEANINHGEFLKLANFADEMVNAKLAGDLYFIFTYKEEKGSKRNGDDLVVQKSITLLESLVGFQLEYDHPIGKTICIESKQIVKEGNTMTVDELGFYNKQTKKYGQLKFVFHIIYPDSISDKAKEAISSVLPKRKKKLANGLETFTITKENNSNLTVEDLIETE